MTMTMCYGYRHVPILDDLLISAKENEKSGLRNEQTIVVYTVVFFFIYFMRPKPLAIVWSSCTGSRSR